MPYLYLAIAIVSEVTATSFMRLSNGFTQPLLTGIAYAIWSGVGIVLIAAIAWLSSGGSWMSPLRWSWRRSSPASP